MIMKMLNRIKSKKGFTLTELIVVIAILAVLAAILVPTMIGILNKSKRDVADANARSIHTAAQAVFVETYISAEPPAEEKTENDTSVFVNKVREYLGGEFNDPATKGDYVIEIKINSTGVTEVTCKANGETGYYPPSKRDAAE